MLLECVLGAMGLAIEQAAHGQPVEDRAGQLLDKTDHLKQVLRRRLASLIERRHHIEALKSRVHAPQTPAVLERLQKVLGRREKAYQERLVVLQPRAVQETGTLAERVASSERKRGSFYYLTRAQK